MDTFLRGLLILATAGALTFPAAPTATVHTTGASRSRAAAPAIPVTPAASQFKADQLEAYLSNDVIAYIRPGIKTTIVGVTNVASGQKPVVEVRFTDDLGQPLDRNGALTPGKIEADFVLAMWNPTTSEYVNLNVVNFGTVTYPLHDIGGTWTDLETGHGKFTFAKALPSGIDPAQTYTLGVYAGRDTKDIVGKDYAAPAALYTFRPDGGTPGPIFDKMNTAACDSCHDPLYFHSQFSGKKINDVKLCVLCHTSQMPTFPNGQTLDFRVLIHRVHDASNLPSVKAGGSYAPVPGGDDFSTVTFPQDIRNCATCHAGRDPKNVPSQSSAWYTNPSRTACGSCHDDINWTTGANHPAGAMTDDSACAKCHVPSSGVEFDASIQGAHTNPLKSAQLKGIKATIVSVSNAAPGKKPTVVYSITNGDGSAVDATKLATFAPILAGPTTSYNNATNWRENGVAASSNTNPGVFDSTKGTTTYTFTHALPASATGTWTVSADIYRNINLKRGDGKADIAVRECAINPVVNVAVTDATPVPRRVVVATNQCNACHDQLALHGGQRMTTLECVICHNPQGNDGTYRPSTAGNVESISFQRLIHRIHSGENLTQDFTIYGYHGSVNNFNDVRFPGDRLDCAKCHAGSSYTLPLSQTGIASVTTLRDYFSPQGPATAACLGCHDNEDAAAHAYLNTANFPGNNTPAEACATCHGTGKDWDVAKVHAR